MWDHLRRNQRPPPEALNDLAVHAEQRVVGSDGITVSQFPGGLIIGFEVEDFAIPETGSLTVEGPTTLSGALITPVASLPQLTADTPALALPATGTVFTLSATTPLVALQGIVPAGGQVPNRQFAIMNNGAVPWKLANLAAPAAAGARIALPGALDRVVLPGEVYAFTLTSGLDGGNAAYGITSAAQDSLPRRIADDTTANIDASKVLEWVLGALAQFKITGGTLDLSATTLIYPGGGGTVGGVGTADFLPVWTASNTVGDSWVFQETTAPAYLGIADPGIGLDAIRTDAEKLYLGGIVSPRGLLYADGSDSFYVELMNGNGQLRLHDDGAGKTVLNLIPTGANVSAEFQLGGVALVPLTANAVLPSHVGPALRAYNATRSLMGM